MPYQKHFAQSPAEWALYDVVVDSQGNGDFLTIGDALSAAPDDDSNYVIYLRSGIYSERLNITRPNVHLIGEQQQNTIIVGCCANGMLRHDGKIPGTYGSRPVNIDACGFSATSLTIKNAFDYEANFAKPADDPSKLTHTQAVALLIGEHGDKAQFKHVTLDSYHDTLYVSAGRSYFEQCTIMGTVDFIFGGGTALFWDCDIIARHRIGTTSAEPMGYVAAPCTAITQKFGLVFQHCRLTKEANVPANSYALGRPWHPTTQFDDGFYADPNAIGHCAYINCEFDSHIAKWDKMSGRDIHGNPQWFYPHESRFIEANNQQHNTQRLVDEPYQISAKEVSEYTLTKIFSDWQPNLSIAQDLNITLHVHQPLMRFPVQFTVLDRVGNHAYFCSDENGKIAASLSGLTLPLIIEAYDRSQELTVHTLVAHQPQLGSSIELSLITEVLTQQLLGGQIDNILQHSTPPVISKSAWLQAHHQTFHALRELA